MPVAPSVAVDVVARGGAVALDPHRGLRWETCHEALTALASVHEATALIVVDASRQKIAEGFALAQSNMTEHLDDFVAALDALDPHIATAILELVDPESCETNWQDRLRGNAHERIAASLLIERATQASGEIREVGLRLAVQVDGIAKAAPIATDEPHS